jgi:RHS repeat-associated protein
VDGRTRVGRSERTLGGTTVFVHQWSWHDRLAEMTETDPLGQVRLYSNARLHGVPRTTAITGPACPSCGPAAQTFDANGNVASRTDWNGNRTNYAYDLSRNLETSRTEGLTSSGGLTPQTRTVSTAWHPSFRLPTQIAEPLRITTNVFDADDTQCGARGALCSRTVQATSDATGAQGFSASPVGLARTWTYTYNANGSVLSADGPRTDLSDLTTYTYHPNDDPEPGRRGNLASITNAAGHATQFSAYNAHGQPTTIVDPNGLVTILSYDARQRLTSRSVGGETTSYAYDGVGQLTRVTLPDGSYLSYTYDSAHRLTGIADNQGNRIAYTLDAMGNRTREEVFDPANALAQTRSRVYSNLNRLLQELGAAGQVTEYGYDSQGNVASVKDPLAKVTANQYDALNRLVRVTDPALGVTQYGYNSLDALTQVADPRGLVTGYTVDGLGNLALQQSPDTGTTASTYDAAGNLLTQTDAKGQTTTYLYDALNRVASITFADGSKQLYAYDAGANALGRLNSITELDPASQATSSIAYAYDQKGRVASESRTVAGVAYATAYAYDAAGRLAGMTYPSGRSVAYAFDSLGRVAGISTTKDGQTQVVVQAVTYHPFGGVKGYLLGNGQSYVRGFDQDGRVASYSLGATTYALGYDAASRIAFIADLNAPANSSTYAYDSLDRLTQAVAPGTPFAYTYDAVGNRLSKTVGAATDTYTYSATSNRIASIVPASGPQRNFVFDANGSTTSDAVNQYAYDARGRMVQALSTVGSSAYQVNALEQRVRKTNVLGDSVFHYDTQGRLIAETDAAGALRREVLYLGDMPVAAVAAAQGQGGAECTASAPRPDPGAGFAPFGAAEQAVARGGNAGPAWEWAIGTDTEASQSAKGSLDWVSGKLYAWTLTYSGAGAATIEVRDAGALVLSRTWTVGMDAGNALQVQVSTNPSIGPGTTMAASVSSINGQALAGAVSQTGNNTQAEQNLFYFYPPMAAGFTASGTVSLTYGSLPAGARVEFKVRAGNLPCTPGPGQAKLYFIHTDHLNTPRLIADEQQRTVWRWDNTDPFGGNPPDENPSGLGTFEFPLRLPGQYADRETALHYNMARDYDVGAGRYIQSDQVGIAGGLNLYSYVNGNPLIFTDSEVTCPGIFGPFMTGERLPG